MELTLSYCVVCSNDIHSQLQENEWVSTLFDFYINPSHKGTLAETTREGFMQKQQMICNLLLHIVWCSNDIHSQLQENEWVSTLFNFCINPSHKGTLAETYTREGFMQKQKMRGNLPLHFVWYVLTIFIAD